MSTTWSDARAAPRDDRPRRWLALSCQRGRPWEDPELSDELIERASDAQLANLLNLYGWPVVPSWRVEALGTHSP